METNERFSYVNSSLTDERKALNQAPKNSIEANNKLTCLANMNYLLNPHYRPFEYACIKRSKRYNRLLKMFWVFYRSEQRKNLDYILNA